MPTTVIHINTAPPNWRKRPDEYVYIGRPSAYGNPYRINSQCGRDSAISAYTDYATQRLQSDPLFHDRVRELCGKVLVCYCAPQACHGDWLASTADALQAAQDHQQKVLANLNTVIEAILQKQAMRRDLEDALHPLIEASKEPATRIRSLDDLKAWRREYFAPILKEHWRAYQ
jgi:hypothetical protein